MTLKNIGLGLLVAAALIAPSLAHAGTAIAADRSAGGHALIIAP